MNLSLFENVIRATVPPSVQFSGFIYLTPSPFRPI